MRANPLQVGMQTRGAGDDSDGCDKHRPPRVGMSPIVILSLCPERRIDIRCFVFPHRVVQVKIEKYDTRFPAAGVMGKPETRRLFHWPYWTRGRLDRSAKMKAVKMRKSRSK